MRNSPSLGLFSSTREKPVDYDEKGRGDPAITGCIRATATTRVTIGFRAFIVAVLSLLHLNGSGLRCPCLESASMAAHGVFVGLHLPHSLDNVLEPMSDSRTA
jgi:hypothetical protein